MTALLERSNQFLDRPLALPSRAFLVVAALFSGVAASIFVAPDAFGRRPAPFILGAFALLLLRAAVHGKIGSLIDVVVLGAYLGLWVFWSVAASSPFTPGPALWPLVASAAGLLAASISAWQTARVAAAEEIRTAP